VLLVAFLTILSISPVRACGNVNCSDVTYCQEYTWDLNPLGTACAQVEFVDCAQPPELSFSVYFDSDSLWSKNVSILSVVPNFDQTYTWSPVEFISCSVSFGIPGGIPYPVDILYYLQFNIVYSAQCTAIGPYTENELVTFGDNSLQYCHNYTDCASCTGDNNCVWCNSGTAGCLAGDYQKEKCDRCPNFNWESCAAVVNDNGGSNKGGNGAGKLSDAAVATVTTLSLVTVAGVSAGMIICYFNPAVCQIQKKKYRS